MLQPLADKIAIGLSIACALHCLALPLVISLLPSLLALGLADEAFHRWMVLGVIPMSVMALSMGCRLHRRFTVIAVGGLGLLFLLAPLVLGHEMLGEWGERTVTLTGAFLIATSHLRNFELCRAHQADQCLHLR